MCIRFLNLMAPLLGQHRVTNIKTNEVARLCEQSKQDVVLVDVRTAAEIAVSTIPGAISRAEFEAQREQMANRTVIAYCTVGGRSLIFAWRYSRRGVKVKNYVGSILAWCDSGRPLNGPKGSPTNRVHTYSRILSAPKSYQQVY